MFFLVDENATSIDDDDDNKFRRFWYCMATAINSIIANLDLRWFIFLSTIFFFYFCSYPSYFFSTSLTEKWLREWMDKEQTEKAHTISTRPIAKHVTNIENKDIEWKERERELCVFFFKRLWRVTILLQHLKESLLHKLYI